MSFATKNADVVNVYKGLIALRKSSRAFTDSEKVVRSSPLDGVVRYVTTNGDDSFEVFFNANDTDYTMQATHVKDYTKTVDVSSGNVNISDGIPSVVPAKSFVILKK